MSSNPKSLVFLAIPLLLLTFLFLTGAVIPTNTLAGLFELIGLTLGLWSIWTMRITTIQITADVAPDSNLITDGPFEFIRHPMYLAIILVAFGLLLNNPTTLRAIVFIVLTIELGIKANYEEKLLLSFFKKGYEDYQKKTKKIIPFIY